MKKKKKTKIDLYGDGIGSVELIQSMGTDLTVVNAARVSFNVEKSVMDHKDEKLIDYLIKHKHTSTLEHNFATFRFKVPLFVRSQHHRHRTWSYNEISRRYTESDIEFYEPKIYRTQHKSNRQASTTEEQNDPLISIYPDTKDENEAGIHLASDTVARHHKRSLILFETLLKAGVCREQARGVLPQNLYTQYYGTCNLNNLLKFIELRIHMGAQWEIQEVAKACLKIAEDIWPVAVGAYRELRGLLEMEVE